MWKTARKLFAIEFLMSNFFFVAISLHYNTTNLFKDCDLINTKKIVYEPWNKICKSPLNPAQKFISITF